MVKTIFELAINLIEIFICVEFVTKYLGCKHGKTKSTLGFVSTWLIGFAVLTLINHITFFETVGAYIPGVIYFVYAIFFLKGSLLLKLWVAVLAQTLVTIIAVVTNLFVCVVIGYDPYLMITVFNSIRIISVIGTKVLLFLITRIMLKFRYASPVDKGTLVTLILIPLLSTISLSCLMIPAFEHSEIRIYLLTGMMAIVMANIFAYGFFVKLNRDYETNLHHKIQKHQYEQQIISQTKHLDEILVMQKKLRAFRHDIQNHFIAISGYFSSAEYQAGIDYINGIKDFISDEPESVDTGNVAFDAIISTKRTVAESKGIEFVTNIQIPEKLNIEAIDLCVIFGNALDNAIEACEKLTDDRRYISLSAVYDEQQLICKIVNSAIKPNETLNTTKPDKNNHGFGFENIKQALSKYNHVMKIDQSNGEFVLSFVIFNC